MKAKAVVLHSNQLVVQALIVALLAFVFSTYVHAATPATVPSKKTVKVSAPAGSSLATSIKTAAPTKQKKALELGSSLVIGTNQATTAEGRKSYSGTYTLTPAISHAASKTSVSAVIEYSREYSYELDDRTDGDWSNGLIKVTKTIPVNGFVDNFVMSPRVSIGLGNEARRQTYKGGVGSTFAVDKKIGKLSIVQTASYAYRFFEFDIRDDGTVNSPHQFEESTALGFQALEWLELQASFGLSHLKSFQGVGRTYSTTGVGASFGLAKNASLSVGAVTLKKSTLEPSGRGNRVKLWDSTDAIAFIELGLSI